MKKLVCPKIKGAFGLLTHAKANLTKGNSPISAFAKNGIAA
jgi:hypothetical protein